MNVQKCIFTLCARFLQSWPSFNRKHTRSKSLAGFGAWTVNTPTIQPVTVVNDGRPVLTDNVAVSHSAEGAWDLLRIDDRLSPK